MDKAELVNIAALKEEQESIDREYAEKLHAYREKIVDIFLHTMEQRGLDELILVPLTPNGFSIGSWDCKEEIDSEFECEEYDMVECTVGTLAYGEAVEKSYDESQVNVITRLGIKDCQLWFHTTEFVTTSSGDLSFGTLKQDNWQAPWRPLTEYHDDTKLSNLLLLYLSNRGNWDFTKDHPECCFLHRKLDSKFIRHLIRENSGKTNLSNLFSDFFQLKKIDLGNLDASSATTVQAMFYHCINLTGICLTGFDTRKCNSFESMFDGCTRLKSLDVSSLNTSCATTMREMFRNCRLLVSLDLSTFDTRVCEDMSMMFKDCKKLSELNLSNWDMTRMDSYNYNDMFEGCKKLSKIYLRNVNSDTFEAINEAVESAGLKNVEIIAEINESVKGNDINTFCDEDIEENLDMTVGKNLLSSKFKNLANATTLDLSGLDTSEIVDGEKMFAKCRHIEKIDLQGLDFSKVRNLKYAFKGCESLKCVSLRGLEISMLMDWWFMFDKCTALEKVDMFGINTSRIQNWRGLFQGCSNLKELNLSGLDVTRANDMQMLFEGCSNLEIIDLSGWDLYLFPMNRSTFEGCKKLNTIILRGCNETTIEHIKDSITSDWTLDISKINFITE